MKRFLFIPLIFYCSYCYAVTNPITFTFSASKLHPDCIYLPNGDSDGYHFHVSYTPYPPNNAETPYIERSNDGQTFTNTGITNPVVNNTNSGLANYSGRGWSFDADPDILNPDFDGDGIGDIWLMIMGPRTSGSPGAPSGRTEELSLAYSLDGKTWTQYDGAAVNGNTDPVIVSGNDSGGQAWEICGGGSRSHLQYPTMIYERSSDTFYLWYGMTGGCAADTEDNGLTNQVSEVGLATFQWNNTTHSVYNLKRNAGNPIIAQPKDATFYYGQGHLDVSKKADDSYEMLGVRIRISDGKQIINKWHSSNKINWTYDGMLINLGSGWDGYDLYRSTTCTDGNGRQVILNGKTQIIYSGWSDVNTAQVGWNDPTNFGTTFTKDTYTAAWRNATIINNSQH